jgi:hypothetical protein
LFFLKIEPLILVSDQIEFRLKEAVKDRKTSHVDGLGELILLRWSKIQCNLAQNTNDILYRTRKEPLKFIWKHACTRVHAHTHREPKQL